MPLNMENRETLLVKYLVGEANSREVATTEAWIGESHENKEYFDRMRAMWVESRALMFEGAIDVTAAWERFRRRCGVTAVVPVYRRMRPMHWMQAVAAAVLLVGAGFVFNRLWHSEGRVATVEVASENMLRTETLPDGSVVKLDPHSGLSYPEGFAGVGRNIVLTGGGFFDVVHDARKPFSIAVAGITVRVLGTSFRISTDPDGIGIAVETGIVEVAGPRRSMKLYAHERLTVAKPDSGWIKQPAAVGGVAVADTTRPVKDTVSPEEAMREKKEAMKEEKEAMKEEKEAMKGEKDAMKEKKEALKKEKTMMKDEDEVAMRAMKMEEARKQRLAGRDTTESNDKHFITMKAILDDLIQRGFAKDRSGLTGVVLSENELVINGVKQPDELHAEFRKKYLDDSGSGYFYGTINVTGHGYFFNKDDFKK